MGGNSQDKRRFPRFTVMVMVRLQQNLKAKSREAYLTNISRGGIGLYTHKRVQVGETYYIRPMSWINLDGLWTVKAIWCKAEGDFIMAGFKFTSMTDQHFDRIKKQLLLSFSM
jgi:hypothetical protein